MVNDTCEEQVATAGWGWIGVPVAGMVLANYGIHALFYSHASLSVVVLIAVITSMVRFVIFIESMCLRVRACGCGCARTHPYVGCMERKMYECIEFPCMAYVCMCICIYTNIRR
jgi:hypothetical protein